MQLKTHTFWGVLFCCVPSLLFAQTVEHFIQSIPSDEGRRLGLNRFTSIVSIEENAKGLYVLTQRNGCYLIDQQVYSDPVLKQLVVPDDRRDHFFGLVSNLEEVFLWANGNEILPLSSSLAERLPYSSAYFSQTVHTNNIAVDSNGTVYVGTFSDGLFVFSRDEWGNYSDVPERFSIYENELPSNTIQCLYRDSNDVIWIGTDAGLASIRDGRVYNLSKKGAMPQKWWQRFLGLEPKPPTFSASVMAIASWGNSLLLAGDDDIYKVTVMEDSIQYLYQYDLTDRLLNPLSDIKELLVDAEGNLWIAANQLLYYNITADRLKVISDTHIFRGEGFLSLGEDVAKEQIWVGTHKGGLYQLSYPDPNHGIGF